GRRRRVGSSSSRRKELAMHDPSSHSQTQTIEFPRETEGLPEARKPELVELADGDEFELEIMPVKKRIGDATVRMLTYNGSVPGPTLDDILIEDGQIAAFRESETTHVAMGRFGNVMLVAGEPDLSLQAKRGEVVRFYFTNTANTRVFNVVLPGAQMKLVGADAGHYEHEELVEEVLLAPSERVVVDVLFPDT